MPALAMQTSMRVDTIKQRALQIYESASSRDIAAACLLNSLQSAIEEGIPARQAHQIVIDAWQEEGLKRIRNWDVRCLGSLIDLFPECVPSRFRHCAFSADCDDEDAQWRVRFQTGQPRPMDPSAMDTGLDAYLMARGVDKSDALQARIRASMRNAAADIQARKAAEPPPLPTYENMPADVKEHLLATWFDTEPTQDVKPSWCGPFWKTAVVDGTTLYTRPGKVMERRAPFLPYEETDGVLYQFVRDGVRLSGWRPGRGEGQVMAADFDYFAKTYAVHISPLGWTRVSGEENSSDPPEQPRAERPRP